MGRRGMEFDVNVCPLARNVVFTIFFTCRVEIDYLQKGFELVKCFSESASEALKLMLGCYPRLLFVPVDFVY